MADVIDRETMEIHKSVNTPDYPEPMFMEINGKILPLCENKYWKIINDEIVEMSTEEKAGVDYVEPIPNPVPPTPEELDKKRKLAIADKIALKHTPADETSYMRKLLTGESELTDEDIIKWLADIADAKAEYPKDLLGV